MKKLVFLLLAVGFFSACVAKGTTEDLGETPDGIILQQYFYADGQYVIIAKFKDSPISTQTYKKGKTQETVVIVDGTVFKGKDTVEVRTNGN